MENEGLFYENFKDDKDFRNRLKNEGITLYKFEFTREGDRFNMGVKDWNTDPSFMEDWLIQ